MPNTVTVGGLGMDDKAGNREFVTQPPPYPALYPFPHSTDEELPVKPEPTHQYWWTAGNLGAPCFRECTDGWQ
jgi:hypothetical protein